MNELMLVNGRILNHSTTPLPSGQCGNSKGKENYNCKSSVMSWCPISAFIHSPIHQTFTETFLRPLYWTPRIQKRMRHWPWGHSIFRILVTTSHKNVKERQDEHWDETMWRDLCEDPQILLSPWLDYWHFPLRPQTCSIKGTYWCASQKRQKVPRVIFLSWSWGSTFWVVTSRPGWRQGIQCFLVWWSDNSSQGHKAVTLCQVLDWASCWAKGTLKASGLCPNQPPLIHNRHLYLQTRQLAPDPAMLRVILWKILSW